MKLFCSQSRLASLITLFACATLISLDVLADPLAQQKRSVFDLPAVKQQAMVQNLHLLALFHAGRFAEAEERARQVIQSFPEIAEVRYNLACILSAQGKTQAALEALASAIDRGFKNAEHIAQDTDLRALRNEPAFKKILERARNERQAQVAMDHPQGAVKDGVALVEEKNTRWNAALGALVVAFEAPPAPSDNQPVVKEHGEAGQLLRSWYAEGTAAGNHGDFYDNHDKNHSNMELGKFPQFTRIEYAEAARKRGLDNGIQNQLLFNRPIIGNSSTAITKGWNWRSLPRLAMVQPVTMRLAALQYRLNHLYFYPEHRDYDDKPGDVYPANHPYQIISQGSSGSDRPFMGAAACIMASFQPETKARLIKHGLLMPTVQMVFRRNLKNVKNDGDYLSGTAHPIVFPSALIDVKRMVTYAHDMAPDSLPPLPVLEVQDLNAGPDKQVAPPRAGEVLFATPQALALVYRRPSRTWSFEVSAEKSADPQEKPLTYAWRVLQGDPSRILIQTGNDGRNARITVDHAEPFPVRRGSRKLTSRIDIGCFVNNGSYWSSPAFISIYMSGREARTYDAAGRVKFIDYRGYPGRYDDPLIFPARDWQDEFFHTNSGQLLGWIRRSGETSVRYSRHGLRVETTDDRGRPLKAQAMRYVLSSSASDDPPKMVPQPLPQFAEYQYAGPEDQLGTVLKNGGLPQNP